MSRRSGSDERDVCVTFLERGNRSSTGAGRTQRGFPRLGAGVRVGIEVTPAVCTELLNGIDVAPFVNTSEFVTLNERSVSSDDVESRGLDTFHDGCEPLGTLGVIGARVVMKARFMGDQEDLHRPIFAFADRHHFAG